MKNEYNINSHDLLSIFLNPHTNPWEHTVTTANITYVITYVITITILQMREQKGREGKQLSKMLNYEWWNRDLNPGSLTLELKLLTKAPGSLLKEMLYLCENTWAHAW